METSLHRQLKEHYAADAAQTEVPVDGYRIDAVVDRRRHRELVEIQHGSLGAIRGKIAKLLGDHCVRVVKPIIARKMLLQRPAADLPVASRRQSPKRGRFVDLFMDLVYFTTVFPHPRLVLDLVLVEIEEIRYPGHGRRRRRRDRDFVIEDQRLVEVGEACTLKTAADLKKLLPKKLPVPFSTKDLAEQLDLRRWDAQKVAYCLRETGAANAVGKDGNAWLYEFPRRRKKSA